MPVKKSNSSGSKKTAAKKSGKTSAKTGVKKKSAVNTGKQKKINIDKTPAYVLSIMVLVTLVILLINNNMNKPGKNNIPDYNNSGQYGRNENNNKNTKEITGNNNTVKETVGIKIYKETRIKENKSETDKDITREYYIYLVKFDKNNEVMSLAPVKRNVKQGAPLADTLNELIKGPNRIEKARGLLTAVPADLRIRDIQVIGRNAVIDFSESIEENADGQILLTRIDQLVYTATQFDGIDAVIIKINGRRREFLGGEGLSLSKPIGRREKH